MAGADQPQEACRPSASVILDDVEGDQAERENHGRHRHGKRDCHAVALAKDPGCQSYRGSPIEAPLDGGRIGVDG